MRRSWTVALTAVAVAVVAYPFLPLGSLARSNVYDLIAAAALAVGWRAVAWHRPHHAAGWVWLLSGFSLWVLGDAVYGVEQYVLHLTGYPALSDIFYLGGYAGLTMGTLALVRSRGRRRDLTALLDASILAVGMTIPAAVFVMAPALQDSSMSALGQVITAAYPVGDVLVMAMLTRLLSTAGAKTWSFAALVGALTATLAADAWWDVLMIVDPTAAFSRWADAGWLASYVFIALAAAHPSMGMLSEPQPRAEAMPSVGRLNLLALGSLLPAATLVAAGIRGDDIPWQPLAFGGAALSTLVLARMAGLLEQVRSQAVQLSALARSDALTGAPNRRSWDFELSRACAAARDDDATLAVAILDMDHFKRFNDQHGHLEGDRLLREAVAAWTARLGPDVYLARYGGEEFALLLPGCSVHDARARLESLRAVTPGGQTFSAGVAAWRADLEPGAVVSAADHALYVAKRNGRDRVEIADMYDRDTLPSRLRDVTVLLEPIVDTGTGAVAGHEVLTRFGHDANVARVFAHAHADGHGDLLEAHVVNRALGLPGRPAGLDLYVRVSAQALTCPRFWAALPPRLDDVVVELADYGPDPTDWAGLHPQLLGLLDRGARLAVDQLGAEGGELSRLLAIGPAILKIDGNIAHGCSHDEGRRQLLGALGDIARAGGAQLCAEGVEDPADLASLRRAGVELAQGQLLGAPADGWAAAEAIPIRRPSNDAGTGHDEAVTAATTAPA